MSPPPTIDLRGLLVRGVRLLDVRAEIEFGRGRMPAAVNLPILTTEERARVGLCYKENGHEAAVALGHRLVRGAVKAHRVAAWLSAANEAAGAHVCCWRGGMRSEIAATWLAEAGRPVPRVPGGYKALRRLVLTELDDASAREAFVVLGGKTGSAKTRLIRTIETGVDLEHHANHRGSGFGRRVTEPAGQADFENSLAVDLMRTRDAHPRGPYFLEDESARIGPVRVPSGILARIRDSPLIVVEVPFAERVEQIHEEYVIGLRDEYEAAFPGEGDRRHAEYLEESLMRIRRRLGGERTKIVDGWMRAGRHREWIELLLREYYDPMYEYQLGRNRRPVVYRGDAEGVIAWAAQELAGNPRSRISASMRASRPRNAR